MKGGIYTYVLVVVKKDNIKVVIKINLTIEEGLVIAYYTLVQKVNRIET